MKRPEGMMLKLVAGCLAPLLAAVVAQSLFTISSERHALMEGLSAKAQAVGRLMVDVAGPSIAFDDAQAVGDGLGYVSLDPDFAYALAVKADGTPMGYRGDPALQGARQARFTLPDQAREALVDGVVEVSLPVSSSGKRVGAVLVGFKSDHVREAVFGLVLRAGGISLLGIGVAVLVVMLLARTIARKNRDMRLVLDSVDQAIFTVRPDGKLLEQRSAVATRIFHDGLTLWDAFATVDPKTGGWLKLGWEALLEGVMPFELLVDQLPHTVEQGERTWRVEYKPLKDGEVVVKWLVVLSDITSELERQRAEAVGSDLLHLLEGLAKDRRGVVTFIAEADRLVRRVVSGESGEALPADLHTLKGISAVHGLESFARLVHQLEDRLGEGHFDELDRRRLETSWASFENRLAFIAGGSTAAVEVTRADLEELMARLESVPGSEAVRARVASLTQEPVRLPLERAAGQARALGKRLGREGLTVTVEATPLRLPERYADFWASFVHVVRNAVDHGIELPAQRAVRGKAPGGTVVMRAVETPEAFCIEVQDDGEGLDFQKLAELARKASLPAETRGQLIQVLFVDGLSTRDRVTEVSGRGVGLGAVRRAVEALGGDIEVESELGKGTLFRFRFPTPRVELALAA
jgi:two-component system chemotaxis sensor kinase CheA